MMVSKKHVVSSWRLQAQFVGQLQTYSLAWDRALATSSIPIRMVKWRGKMPPMRRRKELNCKEIRQKIYW